MSYDKKVWGPIFWYVFHLLSYSYLDGESDKYSNIMRHMANILPCDICMRHFSLLLKKHPPKDHIESREDMIKWINMIHNIVSKRIGGKQYLSENTIKYYYRDDILIVNNDILTKFIQMIVKYARDRKYYIRNYSTIIVLKNLVNVYPDEKIRGELILFSNNHKLTIKNIVSWSNQIIKIIKTPDLSKS